MLRLIIIRTSFALLFGLLSFELQAKNVYQQPEDFIKEVFAGESPEVKRLWLKKELKPKVKDILGHDPDLLRYRYWHDKQRTAWILEEIGKTEPITLGFVINKGVIEIIRVLIFRESRGWEIRHPFFTDQYKNAGLDSDLELTRQINGISGATLSVSAANKLARLALLLHQHSDAVVSR